MHSTIHTQTLIGICFFFLCRNFCVTFANEIISDKRNLFASNLNENRCTNVISIDSYSIFWKAVPIDKTINPTTKSKAEKHFHKIAYIVFKSGFCGFFLYIHSVSSLVFLAFSFVIARVCLCSYIDDRSRMLFESLICVLSFDFVTQ